MQGFDWVKGDEVEVEDAEVIQFDVEDWHGLELYFLDHEFFHQPLVDGWEEGLGLGIGPIPIF